MAAARERFSIRDYAARMRTAGNPGKCSPFARGGDEIQPLPLISVRRYRWWVDELVVLKSAADFRQEIPVASGKGDLEWKEEENARAPSESPSKKTIVKDLQSRKGRQRTPKKIRSIVELFASSSQIDLAVDQSNGGYDDVKEQAEMVLKEEKKAMIKRKRKWKGKKEEFNLKKKKVCEPKTTSSVHIHTLQEPTHKKKAVKNVKGRDGRKKKFVQVKNVLKKHPVRIVLRNSKRFTSTRKLRERNNDEKGGVIKHYRRTKRHESFCDKEDMVGSSSKLLRMDHPRFKSPYTISSEVLAASPASPAVNNSRTSHELPPPADGGQAVRIVDVEDGSNDLINSITHQTIEKSSNNNSSSTGKVPSVLMVDLNHAPEKNNDFGSTNSGDDDFSVTIHKKRSSTCTGIHQEAGVPKISGFTPTEMNLDLNLCPHSWTSCVIACGEVDEREFPKKRCLDADLHLFRHMPMNPPGRHCSPNDLPMRCIEFAGSGFIGLPLTSHGDLSFVDPNKNENITLGSTLVIAANKHVDVNAKHLDMMSNMVFEAGSHQNDRSQWYLNQYHPAKVHHEFNFTEVGSGSLNIENDELVKDDGNGFIHSDSNIQDHAIPDFFTNEELQGRCNLDCQLGLVVKQTIRLMGKNIVVGGDNRECDADRRSCSSKDCETGQSLSLIMSQTKLPNQWMQPELILNRSFGCSTAKLQNLSGSQSKFYLMPEWEPSLDFHIGHGNNASAETFYGTRHHYPTIASYQTAVQQHMMSCSTNSNHTFGSCQPQVRYHDGKSPEPPPEKLPRRLLHAKYSEGNNLSISPDSHPTVQTSAFTPNSRQSSSTSTVTMTNSNSGIDKQGPRSSHANFTGFSSPADDQMSGKRPPDKDDGFPASKGMSICSGFERSKASA